MIIHYCEKCGCRIPPAEVESGAARVNEEGKATCSRCVPQRRGSAKIPVAATLRESRQAIKPIRQDSKIRIVPAAGVEPAAGPLEAPPDEPPSISPNRKPLLIGGAVIAVLLITILIVALSGSDKPAVQESDRQSQQVAALPTLPETPHVPDVIDASLKPNPADDTQKPEQKPSDGYDPRATFALSLLEQAKAHFKEHPDDPWTYQEKLQALVKDHGQTAAAKDAATILTTLNPGPKPADPSLPSEDAWARSRDLLALADPAKHAIDGGWKKDNEALLSDKDSRGKLALPYIPPDEYDLKVSLSRVDGGNNICINLTHLGRPLSFQLAAWGNKLAGWEMLDNKRVTDISSSLHRNNLLENNKRYTLILQMRKDRWSAFLNGQPLAKRTRDLNRSLSPFKDYIFPIPRQLGFLSIGSAYRLDEIRVLEVTGSGKVLTDAETAEASKPPEATPARTEQPPVVTAPQPKASAYAVWLSSYLGHWARQDWAAARRCVDEALRNPELAPNAAELKLDSECLALVELAQQSIPKGLELLKDNRTFTLESTKGEKYLVGRKVKILSVAANGARIEQDLGSGRLTVYLALTDLSPETLFELARLAMPDDGKGKLALVLYRFPHTLKSSTPDAQRFFDALQTDAEKAHAPAELLGRLRAWQRLLDREKLAKKALKGIEQLVAEKKGPDAQAAIDDFTKSFADTAFAEESHEKRAALQTQIAPLLMQPGLVAKFFSGDEKNKRKTLHSTQVVKTLDFNWGDKGPADGVPADNFAIEFIGVLRIAEAGEYAFSWGADDGLEVWLDGKGYGKNKTGQKIDLQPGDHPIRLLYVEGQGNASMWVKWKPPGDRSEKKIPAENLFCDPPDAGGGK